MCRMQSNPEERHATMLERYDTLYKDVYGIQDGDDFDLGAHTELALKKMYD